MARNAKTAVPKEGPFIKTARAKKTPGRTVKVGGTEVIRKPGKKPIAFKKGGLHASLGVPQGQKIPQSMIRAALRGEHGEKARKQALFKEKVLVGGGK
jgi:hypothetical protein